MYLINSDLHTRKLLSYLNQDINSSSYGSFDRYYWGWKKRDFQDSSLAYASIPLYKLLESSGKSLFAFEVLELCVNNVVNIQKVNGSFDQSYPNENHPKICLDITEVFYQYLSVKKNREIENAYRKAISFSLKSEECYGIITNHLAHHLYEYSKAYSILGDEKIREHCNDLINRIKFNTHEEGWSIEYNGADPGYQTRTLRYLTKSIPYLEDRSNKEVVKLCYSICDFLVQSILPDGTLYGAFGSRNTEIIYTYGIEYMSRISKRYSDLRNRVCRSIKAGISIDPHQLDFDNYIRLLDDHIDSEYHTRSITKVNHSHEHTYSTKAYGLLTKTIDIHKLYLQFKLGGALTLYKNNICKYRNSGIIFKDKYGNYWGSKNVSSTSKYFIEDNKITIITQMSRSIDKDLSPFKFIILRLLNLTLLRIKFLSDMFRSIVVNSIISRRKQINNACHTRVVHIKSNEIKIHDTVKSKTKICSAWLVPNMHLFHMASSRYYSPVSTCTNVKIQNGSHTIAHSYSLSLDN